VATPFFLKSECYPRFRLGSLPRVRIDALLPHDLRLSTEMDNLSHALRF